MIDIIKKTLCTGCNSCYISCPSKAIEMKTDDEGFWYPYVDKNLCVKCRKCIQKCPSIYKYIPEQNHILPNIYAAWSNSEMIRKNSTSGGIFSELASKVLDKNGLIVGAEYTDDFLVEHRIIQDINDLNRLRKSKYLQSQINNIYRLVEEHLKDGMDVLFCGTPCQNAGLSRYLGCEYDNLIKVDFICRGVISPLVFKKYLVMLESNNNSYIEEIEFKNKSLGWNNFATKVTFKNQQVYLKDRYADLYMVGYLKYNMYMRPSCHECMYKNLPRISDITLGDFWGIGNTKPHLDENKGTSVVMINSEKGEGIFESIKMNITYEKSTLEEVYKGNKCLFYSPPAGEYRTRFFKYLKNNSFYDAFNYTIGK